MTTTTTRLGLLTSTLADVFRIEDYAANWGVLDDNPGVFICQSDTRPSGYGPGNAGQLIFETDTHLLWVWNGSAFERVNAKGHLGTGSRNSDISNTGSALIVGTQVTIQVPAGGRSVLLLVEGPGVYNTVGLTELALYRDTTLLQDWISQGKNLGTVADQPRPLFAVGFDTPPAGPITTVYSLQFRGATGFGGTSTLQAGVGRPLAIHVFEV